MIRDEIRELHTIDEAVVLLDEWAVAYRELLREFRRLEHRYQEAEFVAEHNAFLLRHLDPFLPDNMQDAKARAAEPKLYAALATLRLPLPKRSPFDEPELAEDAFG